MVDQLQLLSEDLSLFIQTTKKRLALATMANLTGEPPLGTPRDTSFAATNWIPTIEDPFEGVAGVKTGRRTADLNPGIQSAGIAQIRSLGRPTGRDALGQFLEDKIFITNNVPYIGRLNAGHSGQSPPGFVEMSIAQAKQDAS